MVEFSVNQAIERVSDLQGAVVSIYGALSLEFEGCCITHIPRAEIRADWYQSSIWADFDLNALGQPAQWLKQFDGRHVRVTGVLAGPEPEFGGCGHFSLWPAKLVITAIQKK